MVTAYFTRTEYTRETFIALLHEQGAGAVTGQYAGWVPDYEESGFVRVPVTRPLLKPYSQSRKSLGQLENDSLVVVCIWKMKTIMSLG